MKVRDFLYMDIDRLKSALSQLDSGLLESVSTRGERSKQLSAGVQGKIAAIVGASGGAEFLWTNEQTETRTLHDNIYNIVEDALAEAGALFTIPGDITLSDVALGALQEEIHDTQFVLLTGYAAINDFTSMREFLGRFNEIGRFLAHCAVSGCELPKAERSKLQKAQESQMQLPKETVAGLSLIFEVFYKDRIVIKMRPLELDAMGSLVGMLRPEFLREPIDVITFKYGQSPIRPWRMLAQVAAIPMRDEVAPDVPASGGEIEQSMMKVSASMKEVQSMVQAVTYPEIAVTPIAIYREQADD